MHQYLIMSAPSISQYAAVSAMKDSQDDVDRMIAEYDRRRHLVIDGIQKIGLELVEPKGAFYAFPRIKNTGLDCDTFATRLLKEEKVALIPERVLVRAVKNVSESHMPLPMKKLNWHWSGSTISSGSYKIKSPKVFSISKTSFK